MHQPAEWADVKGYFLKQQKLLLEAGHQNTSHPPG